MSEQVEQIAAVLGLVLLTHPNHEVRIPYELVAEGLPENSGVQIEQDVERDELVVRIAKQEAP